MTRRPTNNRKSELAKPWLQKKLATPPVFLVVSDMRRELEVLRAGAMLLAAFQRGSKGTAWSRHARTVQERFKHDSLGHTGLKD